MNRATRVPASTVVRMNSASNMIAKWYQNALSRAAEDLLQHVGHTHRQRGGAAGLDTIDFSPTPRRRGDLAPVIGEPDRPRPLTNSAAVSAAPPSGPPGH